MDVFRTIHMDGLNVPRILLLRSETYADVWVEEEQSLPADEGHGTDRVSESETTRGRTRPLAGCEEAIPDGIETKPGNRLVSITTDM